MKSNLVKGGGSKWLERYMPFVARSPEMQVEWLERALQKQVLAPAEIAPYVRLLLENDEQEHKNLVGVALENLSEPMKCRLLEATGIYEIPKLFPLLNNCTLAQVQAALLKDAPPYEAHPRLIRDRLFFAVHSKAPELFAQAVAGLKAEGKVSHEFCEAYQRFLELLEDEKLLSALYPKARATMEIDIKDLEALQAL